MQMESQITEEGMEEWGYKCGRRGTDALKLSAYLDNLAMAWHKGWRRGHNEFLGRTVDQDASQNHTCANLS